MGPVAPDTEVHRRDDEAHQLITAYEECREKQHAAFDQLSNLRHSVLYPGYMKLRDALNVIRIECDKKYRAFKAHRKKMRERD